MASLCFLVFVILASIMLAMGMPHGNTSLCGTEVPDEFLADMERMAREEEAMFPVLWPHTDVITVQILFHDVYGGKVLEPHEQKKKKKKLTVTYNNNKEDFAPHNIRFELVDITRTDNEEWALKGWSGAGETLMKKTLRRGSYATLNIYIVRSLGGLLGYTYLPKKDVEKESPAWWNDGILIVAGTLPGGGNGKWLGRTATHEIGHWLGLLHPFYGGDCDGPHDRIKDTPAQNTASFKCDEGKDSCPKKPGKDSIHNYMDYSPDSCMNEFTPGQSARMRKVWAEYRLGKK
ncbi:hypothetical protein GGS20DRAFT_551854 [Poronia punctata]|nr:hypothetical protein GGS20DRAFT_551854 [Poronia punctata]